MAAAKTSKSKRLGKQQFSLSNIEEWVFSWLDLILQVIAIVLKRIQKTSRPITKVLFSRKPLTPDVIIKDVRANRIKLEFTPRLSSPFNVDEYEVEFCEGPPESVVESHWKSIGKMELDFRTVARLKAGTRYSFRARAVNNRGCSPWTQVLTGVTKKEPVDGGSKEEGFVWTQNATEVSFLLQVPPGVTKRNLKVDFAAPHLRVQLTVDGQDSILLEGDVPHTVRKFMTGGSYWELVKDKQSSFLSVTLEKQDKSVAPKFDYWRSCFVGYHEIDTHKIESDPADKGIIQGSSLSPAQLAQLGVRP